MFKNEIQFFFFSLQNLAFLLSYQMSFGSLRLHGAAFASDVAPYVYHSHFYNTDSNTAYFSIWLMVEIL